MSKVRTLVADDHEVVRSGICNALKIIEVLEVVGEVSNGPELRASLYKRPPDLLILDVTMPEFDPISEIREIRSAYPNTKILVVSAYDDDVYVEGLLSAGVNGYHLKDQPLSDLRLAVERVLMGEKWVSSRLVNKLIDKKRTLTKSQSESGANVGITLPHGFQLTARQSEIMELLQEGLDNNSIARRMKLSIKTIENHLTRLYRQLNVQSRMEAVSLVRQMQQASTHDNAISPASTQVDSKPAGADVAKLHNCDKSKISIMLVDDNARYRSQLRRMVGKACEQAMVHEADSIATALGIAVHQSPSLALVDVVLGDEDGIECTRRIKAAAPMMRIVLITAYPDREFHRRGLEAGAVALIDKKILDTPTLRQVIEDSI